MLLAAVASKFVMLLGSLPSPGSNEIVLGPLHLRAYGLMIALGVIAAYQLSRRRWQARGGDPDDITTVAMWAVPAGLIGARIYHVVTDWKMYFPDRPTDIFAIWQGGLGIPGGILGGVIVGVVVARRRGMRIGVALDVVAPTLALAQAIGRWGNWFNQELFGRPTDLPWGLEIDGVHRPVGYGHVATFHPTFAYEMLWNLALFAVLIMLDRRRILRRGNIFILYVLGYGVGRLWVESLRIDSASLLLGVRVNIWMSALIITGAAVALLVNGVRFRPGDATDPYIDDRDGNSAEIALDSSSQVDFKKLETNDSPEADVVENADQ